MIEDKQGNCDTRLTHNMCFRSLPIMTIQIMLAIVCVYKEKPKNDGKPLSDYLHIIFPLGFQAPVQLLWFGKQRFEIFNLCLFIM